MQLNIYPACLDCGWREFRKHEDVITYWNKDLDCEGHKVLRFEECIHVPICALIKEQHVISKED